MSPKSGEQTLKITFTTAQTVFVANSSPKIATFCVCVQMFSKNSILNLNGMLLHNQLLTVHHRKGVKSGLQIVELTCAMGPLLTSPKYIVLRPNCTFVVLPKLLVNFKNKKKISKNGDAQVYSHEGKNIVPQSSITIDHMII